MMHPSSPAAERRRKRAFTFIIAAAASLFIAAVTLGVEARLAAPDRVVGRVLPDLARQFADARTIRIVSRDANYRIARTAQGWAMTDRGDFPVQARRLAELSDGLRGLAYVRRMTADPAQHERLGVDDPTQAGAGILVQIENAEGGFIVNLILGVTRDAIYARRPNENQVWAVRGDLPPLRDAATWLDLTPLALEARELRRVAITPPTGPAYVLERADGDGDFAFAGPASGRTPISTATLSTTATRLTRLQPIDVLPAAAIAGPPVARLTATTASGAQLNAEFVTHENRIWMRVTAQGAAGPAQTTADAVNARAGAWAFALSQAEYEALAPALDSLVLGATP